jgi:DNA-binding NarL/FixJ family response regulator
MLRIFIADDHPIVRQGLCKLIEQQPDMQVAGEAGDGRQVLTAEGKDSWSVLILDLSLPRVNGIEVLRRMRAEHPQVRVIILSMYPEDQYGLRMIGEGAAAYLSKDQPAEDLLRAIRSVGYGGTYMSPDIVAQLRQGRLAESGQPLHHSLTAREHQVFTLLCEGRTVSEIATELDISVSTVSNHVSHIKEKLNVRSLGEILKYAHRAGLLGST